MDEPSHEANGGESSSAEGSGLEKSTPPIDVQHRDDGGQSLAPLDQTTPKIDSVLGSEGPSGRGRNGRGEGTR